MTERQFETTIDWSEFWKDAGEERRTKTAPAAQFTLDPLRSFVEAKGVPGSVADVGCGPGTVPSVIATQFPGATVVGYDAAEPVLAENRERAEQKGHANLAFEQTVRPSFDPDRSFELVTCFYTPGTWPQSVWSVAGEEERYPAWRHNPMVYVPKTA